MFFLGIDGGSSKTECILADEKGKVLSHKLFSGSSYIQLGGQKPFEAFFRDCIGQVLEEGHITSGDITGAVIGIPAYGELAETEDTIPQALGNILPLEKLRIVNDAVVGWSGSLGAQPGINVVSGTGSIAFGMDQQGNECRVGGWSLFFDDEGSCSWIGIKAMSLFFKQADGRLPKTQLYDVFREHYGLKKDIYLSEMANKDIDGDHSRFARMQFLAEKAYKAGDVTVKELYREAAEKLAGMVQAVRRNLHFDNGTRVMVSYSGSLFKAGGVILEPFKKYISDLGMDLRQPRHGPAIGALALAASPHLAGEDLERMIDNAAQLIGK